MRTRGARREITMNYRKRRANAWAGLYVGLVGDAVRTDGETSDRDESPRAESEN